jgi:hypothetical protein
MHIQESSLATPFRIKVRHENQSVCAKQRGIETELDEEFDARFRNDASDPRAKMVHLPYTAFNLAAVMSAVRLKVQTCRAKWRSAVIVADKDVFQPEVLYSRLKIAVEGGAALVGASRRVFAAWPGRRRSLFLLHRPPIVLSSTAVMLLLRLQRPPLLASRNITRIRDDCVYEASVAHEDR